MMRPDTFLSGPFVAQSDSPLAQSVEWLTGLVSGTVAAALCVLAVALIGLLMLGGRVHMRRSARILVGCFLLLGAPAITGGLLSVVRLDAKSDLISPDTAPIDVRPPLPPSNYDPYAGASLRSD